MHSWDFGLNNRKSGISKNGNYYSSGKNKYRVILSEKEHHQAILLFLRPGGERVGYVWLNQDRIRHLRELLDRDRADYINFSGKDIRLKIEKREDNEAIMTLRTESSSFLDYFWLKSDDVIDVLSLLYKILPAIQNTSQVQKISS